MIKRCLLTIVLCLFYCGSVAHANDFFYDYDKDVKKREAKWNETIGERPWRDNSIGLTYGREPSLGYMGIGGSMNAGAPSTDDSKKSCSTSKPVIVTTGEKHKTETDFVSRGLSGLSLARTYRSKNASGTWFGANWMSNLDFPKLALSQPFTSWSGA